jgi:hypothetical protein
MDLGEDREVGEAEIVTSTPGLSYELRASAERGTAVDDFEVIEAVAGAQGSERIEMDDARGRYWLLWITQLPGGGGGSAAVSEVRFFGT